MTSASVCFDGHRRYAGFVDVESRVATIVSSAVSDAVTGRLLGPVLLVSGEDGCICDLEIGLSAQSGSPIEAPDPETVSRLSSRLDLRATWGAGSIIGLSSTWLSVTFEPPNHGRWWQVGASPLFLLVDEDRLAVLAFHCPQSDVGGSREARWLEEIGASEAAVARPLARGEPRE